MLFITKSGITKTAPKTTAYGTNYNEGWVLCNFFCHKKIVLFSTGAEFAIKPVDNRFIIEDRIAGTQNSVADRDMVRYAISEIYKHYPNIRVMVCD